MSAYIVSREHIRFLVNAALSRSIVRMGSISWVWNIDRERAGRCLFHAGCGRREAGLLPHGDLERAAEVGQMLWDENVASVRYRYPGVNELPGPADADYDYGRHQLSFAGVFEPGAVLKACDGYEYQACEHPGWSSSEAKAFIESLRGHAWRKVPGYEDAPWEVTA